MAKNTYKDKPDISGNFGDYGGRYVAETLMPLIIELENAYNSAKDDPLFIEERESFATVSYTHLTLPTIYSV